ncbi:MAG: hypothetical protein ACD_3C00086G0018 [uncultured bacterium (gcode 4)]|uniref:Uncharacterized protein n=1 Tax=uncultured bacterium (gcode 4) TaxID=1234023 RepID=K2GD95_9BACT|nr:MAG: hypothetical protein ACD_3C00086G0018 [uncultured bacterium (gcode 4)]
MIILNFLKSNMLKKIVAYSVILILWLCIIGIGYSLLFEQDEIAIDRYNFEQLEKVKPILEKISKTADRFYSLDEFNKKFGKDIIPKKNCYYVTTDFNWNYPFIFWFQLESLLYKFLYFWKYYAYPKYDMPYKNFCIWWPWWWCIDWSRQIFETTISHQCRWGISWQVYNDRNKNWIIDIWEGIITDIFVYIDDPNISYNITLVDWNGFYQFADIDPLITHKIWIKYPEKYEITSPKKWYYDITLNSSPFQYWLNFLISKK